MRFGDIFRLFPILALTIFFFACGEDDSNTAPVQPMAEPEFGAVSGRAIDAQTGNPIPGVVVSLLNQAVETGDDGKYAFAQVDYSDALTLTAVSPDYAAQTLTFALHVERLVFDIAMLPLTDSAAEIQQALDAFSALIESKDVENLEAIQAHFSEAYFAADDPVTRFGLATGVIPANFEAVIPSIAALFEAFNRIQFVFRDVEIDVAHARKASTRLKLDIITESGPRRNQKQIFVQSQIDFRKEGGDWKITFWQLFEVEVRL